MERVCVTVSGAFLLNCSRGGPSAAVVREQLGQAISQRGLPPLHPDFSCGPMDSLQERFRLDITFHCDEGRSAECLKMIQEDMFPMELEFKDDDWGTQIVHFYDVRPKTVAASSTK